MKITVRQLKSLIREAVEEAMEQQQQQQPQGEGLLKALEDAMAKNPEAAAAIAAQDPKVIQAKLASLQAMAKQKLAEKKLSEDYDPNASPEEQKKRLQAKRDSNDRRQIDATKYQAKVSGLAGAGAAILAFLAGTHGAPTAVTAAAAGAALLGLGLSGSKLQDMSAAIKRIADRKKTAEREQKYAERAKREEEEQAGRARAEAERAQQERARFLAQWESPPRESPERERLRRQNAEIQKVAQGRAAQFKEAERRLDREKQATLSPSMYQKWRRERDEYLASLKKQQGMYDDDR